MRITDERWVAQHFVVAIVNSDVTGLSEREEDQLDDFEAQLGRGEYIIFGQEADWAKCAITNLMSNCVKAKICSNELN